jgi:hypothetical protein
MDAESVKLPHQEQPKCPENRGLYTAKLIITTRTSSAWRYHAWDHEGGEDFCLHFNFAADRRAQRGLGKPETFNFLGFTFICERNSRGQFLVKRIPWRDRMRGNA